MGISVLDKEVETQTDVFLIIGTEGGITSPDLAYLYPETPPSVYHHVKGLYIFQILRAATL